MPSFEQVIGKTADMGPQHATAAELEAELAHIRQAVGPTAGATSARSSATGRHGGARLATMPESASAPRRTRQRKPSGPKRRAPMVELASIESPPELTLFNAYLAAEKDRERERQRVRQAEAAKDKAAKAVKELREQGGSKEDVAAAEERYRETVEALRKVTEGETSKAEKTASAETPTGPEAEAGGPEAEATAGEADAPAEPEAGEPAVAEAAEPEPEATLAEPASAAAPDDTASDDTTTSDDVGDTAPADAQGRS